MMMFTHPKRGMWILTGSGLLLCACSVACHFFAVPSVTTFPNVGAQFVNQQRGWIFGPRVFRTDDGGNSWKIIRADGPATIISEDLDNEQRRIHFVDERAGFYLNRRSPPRDATSARLQEIYKTVDGGETWTETATPAGQHKEENFQTIFFRSPMKGWLIGKDVYSTEDGAVTWSRLGATPLGDHTRTEKPQVGEGYPSAVSFINEKTLVLARKDGDVHRSEDGGATWRRVWSVNVFLRNVYFFNDKAGWIVGENGFVGRTMDGGISWEQTKVPTNSALTDVFFLNDKKGWMVGFNGSIIYSTDGGSSWSHAYAKVDGSGLHLASVCFVDEKRGWAVGGKPFDDLNFLSAPSHSNVILESQDGGQTWVQRKL
jgi:photosystem II stability/assembly factor-like uncharacterized protein